jgi:dTDP-4-dehydrorhamnose 3,5-epimerase-like enzyme/dTDP-4-dehydrorhamnose reductase
MNKTKDPKFFDQRGKLFFPINKTNTFSFEECTVSVNNINVFRGVHANPFDKLVTCIKGKILDIIIDLDDKSKNYLIPQYFVLDPNTDNFQLLVPKNFGHAFLALENDSIIIYHFNGSFTEENTTHINYLDPLLNIKLPINNPILSEKDNKSNFLKPIEFVVFGYKGFLGSNIIKNLEKKNKVFVKSDIRLNETNEIEKLLTKYKPKRVINCAGLTGTPNIFWCDDNKIDTIETNIIFQMTMAKICNDKNIHLTILGSGGIFKNDKSYSECDEGNFDLNFYSKSRIYLENMVKNYKNVLYTRINYPICNYKSEKNLLTKLLKYTKIDDTRFSITCIDDLFPKLIDMIDNNETGVCNLVNEGFISPVKIMEIYNKYFFREYEISKGENLNRSYARLNVGLLKKYNVAKIEDVVENCICEYIKNN